MQGNHLIIGGDFNTPNIDWSIPALSGKVTNTAVHQALLDVTSDHGFEQMQHQPTRGENVLDLLFTNNPSLVNHCGVIPGISDHEMVVADQEIKPVYNKRKPRKIFLYQKTDWQTFKLKVTEMANHIAETVNTRTVNENWELFKNGIHNLMKDIIPSKLATSRSNLPWMTTKLRRIIKKKHKLYQKAKKSKKDHDWAVYQKHKSSSQKALRNAQWDSVQGKPPVTIICQHIEYHARNTTSLQNNTLMRWIGESNVFATGHVSIIKYL